MDSFINSFNEFCRISRNNRIVRNVLCHNASRTNDTVLADCNARKYCGCNSNSCVLLDMNRLGIGSAPVFRVEVMVQGCQVHLWGYENPVFKGYSAPVHECAQLLDYNTFPDAYVLTVVHIEWRHEKN